MKTEKIMKLHTVKAVGSKCDFCEYQEIDYIEVFDQSMVDFVGRFVPEGIKMTELSTCALCGKEFCNMCFDHGENTYDTACEDGALCPECGKTHYMDDSYEGVGVLRRSDNKPVEARWL